MELLESGDNYPKPAYGFSERIHQIKIKICELLGHQWQYKDYSHFIQSNGDKYEFTASRNCSRCNQHAYYFNAWENQEKSTLDFESDDHATGKIMINKIIYN